MVFLSAALLALAAFFPPAPGPVPALAAGLADDHTVLYYLVEMQRRVKKNCQGQPLPEAPSLLPSGALRDLAAQSAKSGQPPDAVAAASLAGTPWFAATAYGQSPQQAFDSLMDSQCRAVMGQDFRFIGA
jgi:hypothetical protein